MTEHEIKLATALARCSFCPGHPHKRFAKDMARLAVNSPGKVLSEKQRDYMNALVWKYRRQMPKSLVPGNGQTEFRFMPRLPPVFRREIDI